MQGVVSVSVSRVVGSVGGWIGMVMDDRLRTAVDDFPAD
jgi:hypothetical protein